MVTTPLAPCSDLIPKTWLAKPVQGADFPSREDLAADPATAWRTYAVRESGQRVIANDRFADGVAIVQECERRDAAAFARLARPWWKFWVRASNAQS